MDKTVISLLFCFLLTSHQSAAATSGKLLVLLVDGLKWDYITDDLPGFNALKKGGVKAEYSMPQFPSVTLSNWMSMLTGVYPEMHGLINNYIYDKTANISFTQTTFEQLDWVSALPVYYDAAFQGKNVWLYYWLDCNMPPLTFCKERYPDMSLGVPLSQYNTSIFQSISSMKYGLVDLAGLYYERIDAFGHHYGPNSPQIRKRVEDLDQVILSVVKALDHPKNDINLLIVSDHGMVGISPNRSVEVTAHLNQSDIEQLLTSPPITFVYLKDENKTNTVYERLAKMHPNVTAYRKDELPARWHIANHHRIPQIVLVADMGWTMYEEPEGYPHQDHHQYSFFGVGEPLLGYHGYDNIYPDMWGSFMAYGPDFKKGYKQPGFPNQDVYLIMCHILGIEPKPNNATWSNVQDMFSKKKTPPVGAAANFPSAVILLFISLFVSVVAMGGQRE